MNLHRFIDQTDENNMKLIRISPPHRVFLLIVDSTALERSVEVCKKLKKIERLRGVFAIIRIGEGEFLQGQLLAADPNTQFVADDAAGE